MNITFVTSKINFERAGGSVPDLDLKVRDMQKRGAHTMVITVFSENNKLPELPYPVVEEYIHTKTLLNTSWRIFRMLRTYGQKTDVFHVEGQFLYGAALYRFLGGKPMVVFFNREILVWERGGFRRLVRRTLEAILMRALGGRVDHLYFTTPQLRDCYRRFGLQMLPSRTSVLLDFFDPTAIRQKAQRYEHRTFIRLFASGRMIKEKGFELLVEALAMLPVELRKTVRAALGGDGPEREQLVTRVREKGLSQIVEFPGWVSRDDFWKYLSNADVFILPRWRIEQPSVVVMEALSLGIPTVAPGGGGVEWMAKDAIVPFKDGDVRSLEHVLENIVRSKEERDKLTQAARRRVEEINHEVLAPQLWNIFQGLV